MKSARARGITVLLSSPSGTGKSVAAEILAAELGVGLFRIDLADVVSRSIGETEKNLDRIFDAAEGSDAVLFFDEADALFGKRTQVRDAHDRFAGIAAEYLLDRAEDYAGVTILAIRRRALAAAVPRRLRFIANFPFPSSTQRREKP